MDDEHEWVPWQVRFRRWRRRFTVNLAGWAGDRGYHRVVRLIYAWWRVRNRFTEAVWYPHLDRHWHWFFDLWKPRCPKHPKLAMMKLGEWVCPVCMLHRVGSVHALNPHRKGPRA